MPLFGGKKEGSIASVRSVPRWEEALKFLGTWFGLEYEIARIPSVQQIYRTTEFEAARDLNHITQLLPSSANVNAHFKDFESLRLDQLNLYGSSNDQAIELVGYSDTQVNRVYIDGFVACMNQVYTLLWTDIRAMVRKPFPRKPIPYPMALISDPMTFLVSPFFVRGGQHLASGTYYPAPKARG